MKFSILLALIFSPISFILAQTVPHVEATRLWTTGLNASVVIEDEGFEFGLGNFTNTGIVNWTVSGSEFSEGSMSASSNLVVGGQTAILNLEVNVPANYTATLEFSMLVDTMLGPDIDDDVVVNFKIDGFIFSNNILPTIWTTKNFYLIGGIHTLSWEVSHKSPTSDDKIIAYLDHVVIKYQSMPAFRMADGSEGFGKVLMSDEYGNASWQSLGSATGFENPNSSNLVPLHLSGNHTIGNILRIVDGNGIGVISESHASHGFRATMNEGDGFQAISNDFTGFRASDNLTGFVAADNSRFGFRASNNDSLGFLATANLHAGFYAEQNRGSGFEANSNNNYGFLAINNISGGYYASNNEYVGFSANQNAGHGFSAVSNDRSGFISVLNKENGFYSVGSGLEGFFSELNESHGFYAKKNKLSGFVAVENDSVGFSAVNNLEHGFYSSNNGKNGFLSSNNPLSGYSAYNNTRSGYYAFGNVGYGVQILLNQSDGIYSSGNTGDAGYFDGTVTVTGNLSKGGGSFKIDHPLDPENKYLYHSFVESPDMMNVYNGNVILDHNGEATIVMQDWFGALNKDFRYQLTCIGGFAPVYIDQKIENNQFRIAGGTPGMEVSWQVTGIRKDPYAEKNRIPVEEEKPIKFKGYYLHPEAYNQRFEKSNSFVKMGYQTMEELKKINAVINDKKL